MNKYWLLLNVIFPLVAMSISCKPKQKSSTKANDFATCQTAVPTEAEKALESAVKVQIDQFLAQQISEEQRDQAIASAVAQASQGDPKKEAVAKALVATQSQLQSTDRVLPVLLKYLASKELTAADVAVLTDQKLGLTPEAFLAKIIGNFKPYYQCMVDAGAKVKDDGSWDIYAAKINLEVMRTNPCLRTAVGIFFSAAYASEDAQLTREAIFVGDNVIQVCRDLPVITKTEWNRNLKSRLAEYNREIADYLKASGQSASYTEMMRAGNSWWKDEGLSSGSSARIDADGAYNNANSILNAVQCYGIKKDMRIQLRNLLVAANKHDTENINAGLNKLAMAEYAAIAAVAIPVAMYATPIVGANLLLGSGGLSSAAVLSAGAAKIAMMSMAFGVGLSATLHSVVDTANYGGNFFCRFAENLATHGSTGLVMTAFTSLLPLSTALAGSGAALYTGSAALGTNVYGVSNVLAALGFIGYGGYNSVNEIVQCRKLLNQSIEITKTAENEADVGRANALINDAQKLCLQGGIDIFFSVKGGLEFYKNAKKAFSKGEASDTNAMCLDGQACSLNSKPRFNDALSNARLLAMNTLKLFIDFYANAQFNLNKVKTGAVIDAELGESLTFSAENRGSGLTGTVKLQVVTTPEGGYRGFKVITNSSDSGGKSYNAILDFADPAAAFEIQAAIDTVNAANGAAVRNPSNVKLNTLQVVADAPGSKSVRMPLLSKIVNEATNRLKNPDAPVSGTSLTNAIPAKATPQEITGFMESPPSYQKIENYLGAYESGMIKVNADIPYWQQPGAAGVEPPVNAAYTIKVAQVLGGPESFKGLTTQLYQSAMQNAKSLLAKYPNMQKVTIDAGQLDGSQKPLINILKGMGFSESNVNASTNAYTFDVTRS